MNSNNNNNDNTKTTKILIGVDVHMNSFAASFFNTGTGEFCFERNDLPADNETLASYIKRIQKRHFYDGNYSFEAAYEAGYTGYSTARYLNGHNIDCVIMAPNTIRRNPKEKKQKTDLMDSRLIARTLNNRDFSEVLVPTPEEESVSHLLRDRSSISKSVTKAKNQITSLLAQLGFKSEAGKWSEKYFKDIADFMEESMLEFDVFTLEDLLDELEHQQKRKERVDKMIDKAIEQDEERKNMVAQLCSLKGIDTFIAANIVSVAKDATRFKTAESFANYLGLAPGESSSGERQKRLGITKSGNSTLRSLLILAAKTYSRGNPYCKSKQFLKNQEGLSPEMVEYSNRAYKRLHKKYCHLRNDLCKNYNVCTVAVARELACFCWGILTGNVA